MAEFNFHGQDTERLKKDGRSTWLRVYLEYPLASTERKLWYDGDGPRFLCVLWVYRANVQAVRTTS